MGKIIKCHFYYLMNKLTIIIFIFTIIGIVFYALLNISSYDDRVISYMIANDYYLSIYEVLKLIMFVFVIFLFGYSFNQMNDGYHAIVIGSKITRTKYIISKIMMLILIFTFLYLLAVTAIIIIGLLYRVAMSKEMLKSFACLYILLMIYGELSVILVLLFDNIYIVFLLVPLSLISYDKTIYFLTYILPIEDKHLTARALVQPIWYYVFESFAVISFISLLFYKKDLPC